MRDQEPRIGIYVCRCGGNIGDVVDVKAVIDEVKKWKGVEAARWNEYVCSDLGQEIIVNDIINRKINRVIVASCTPRMHLSTFQSVLERAGLNPYLLEFVNIREHCSWVHGPQLSPDATRKALSIIKGGYKRSFELEPLEQIIEKCSKDILIIGGGIAGIVASIELGNMGYTTYLLDRYPSIGGHMAKLTKVFPTIDCAQCILTPMMAEVGRHKNVKLLTYAEVKDVKGFPGNYEVEVYMKPRGVDVKKCVGCGVCANICPVTCPDEFNECRLDRKAAYIPFNQAVPYVYTIDFDTCTKCGKCMEKCPSKAINLEDEVKLIELNVGSIIIATGYELFDARKIGEYGYGVYPDVITLMDMERLTSLSGPTGGKIMRLSDGGDVKRIGIVLCAGSRDQNRFIPYCSRICCMYSLKQAILLKEQFGIDVWIYYIDIRAAGRGYEELYWRAQDSGIVFVRGKVFEIGMNRSNSKLTVTAEDTVLDNVIEQEFDLVALAVPMIPSSGFNELAHKLRLPLGSDGFVQEKHPKLEPLNSLLAGVFAAGCALGPKDVRDTVSDALGAAAKVSSFLNKGYIVESPEKAFIISELCDSCGLCLKICPLNAITLTDRKAEINPLLCNGCGACVPECPKEAIDFKNSTKKQIFATIRGLLADKKPDEVRIIAFIERNIAYTGTDLLGIDRIHYPQSIRIISVPSTAIIGLKHMLYTIAMGADGIILIEGQHEINNNFMRKRMEDILSSLEELGIESVRIYYRLVELPAYKKISDIFNIHVDLIKEIGPFPVQILSRLKLRGDAWIE